MNETFNFIFEDIKLDENFHYSFWSRKENQKYP